MKNNRHGKAAILTDQQLDQLLAVAPSQQHATLWTCSATPQHASARPCSFAGLMLTVTR